MNLAPAPTSLAPAFVAQMIRSDEWCPWPLKCMLTKLPISGREIGGRCFCANCTLWFSNK
jgi:hypothetical protein